MFDNSHLIMFVIGAGVHHLSTRKFRNSPKSNEKMEARIVMDVPVDQKLNFHIELKDRKGNKIPIPDGTSITYSLLPEDGSTTAVGTITTDDGTLGKASFEGDTVGNVEDLSAKLILPNGTEIDTVKPEPLTVVGGTAATADIVYDGLSN